jgi:hypothetical protein
MEPNLVDTPIRVLFFEELNWLQNFKYHAFAQVAADVERKEKTVVDQKSDETKSEEVVSPPPAIEIDVEKAARKLQVNIALKNAKGFNTVMTTVPVEQRLRLIAALESKLSTDKPALTRLRLFSKNFNMQNTPPVSAPQQLTTRQAP